MRRRPAVLLAVLLAALAVAGCGDGEGVVEERVDEIRQRAEARADEVRADLRRRRDELRKRIEEVLGELERAIPQARETSPRVQSRGRTGTQTIDQFLTDVLTSVDAYWTTTLRENGRPEPRVGYRWVPPGARERTACGAVADDRAAFYCPGDDTIYIAQQFASDLYRGVLRGLPGEQAGYGRAAGDFAVAYVVAHEYAHNLQDELDLFTLRGANSSKPFELQADCLAGSWGNSVFAAGRLQEGDIQEAIGTAEAVGDFDYTNANHHGTPSERRAAFVLGFEGGEPSQCSRYLPAAVPAR